MDSLTHIVFGAALGEAMLGKRIGHRSALIGAVANSLPDLDVIATSLVKDDLQYLVIHRSYSHAALVLILAALPLAWLFRRIFKDKFSFKEGYLFWSVALVTHSLLDCFTAFGTQLLLPFSNIPVTFNNLSIIDPLFTLPILILAVICLFLRKESKLRQKIATSAIVYPAIYIAFTFIFKIAAHSHFEKQLEAQHINVKHLYTTPTLFNCMLWSAVATTDDTVYTGEYSLLQKSDDVSWLPYARKEKLLDEIPLKKDVEILKWFCQDKYFALQKGDTIQFYNIKWGRADFRYTKPDETFLFYFRFYKQDGKWKRDAIEPSIEGKFQDAIQMLLDRMLGKPMSKPKHS